MTHLAIPLAALGCLTTSALAQTTLFTIPGSPGTFVRAGGTVVGLGDLNGDGSPDFALGEPGFMDGKLSVRSGVDGAEIYSLLGSRIGGQPTRTGRQIIPLDDVNGDGAREYVMTEPVALNSLGSRLSVRNGADGSQIYFWTNRTALNERGMGNVTGNIGDFDGDGFDDIATISFFATGGQNVGIYSPGNGSRLFDIPLAGPFQNFWTVISRIGDIDGDGREDFALGARFAPPASGAGFSGMVRVIAGGTGLTLHEWAGADFATFEIGSSIQPAGDIDGDGVPDIYVGGADQALAVSGATGLEIFAKRGPLEPLFNGGRQDVYAIPDVDFDGTDDLAVLSTAFGDTYITERFMKIYSSRTAEELFYMPSLPINSTLQWVVLESLTSLGDINGDGLDDIAIYDPYVMNATGGFRAISLDLVTATFCESTENSIGLPGKLMVTGTGALAANDLELRASNLPPASTVMFLGSLDRSNLPLGLGTLCLGGAIGRFNRPGEIQVAGGAGNASLPIDLNTLSTPSGSQPATVGDVWRFQAWYRDIDFGGNASSNLTSGAAVLIR